MKVPQEVERTLDQARQRFEELQEFDKRLQQLLNPHKCQVQSRSAWVKEKVNEIVAQGYHPNRDYGVRVKIEPVKQAGIMPANAERVRG